MFKKQGYHHFCSLLNFKATKNNLSESFFLEYRKIRGRKEVCHEREKEPQFRSGELAKGKLKGYHGMDPEISLQSVNFATTENSYLNEHYQEDSKENE